MLHLWLAFDEADVVAVGPGFGVDPDEGVQSGGVDELQLAQIEEELSRAAAVRLVDRLVELRDGGQVQFAAKDDPCRPPRTRSRC
jgi:hypothetical protein